MARNEEKSQSMLHRYLREKDGGGAGSRARRPHLATLCDDLASAERWRGQVEGEVRRRVSEIHGEGLDEGRVRELNDAINKLLRERRHWDRRVVHLGGARAQRPTQHAGALDVGGYLYFGKARELPAVRDAVRAQEAAARGAADGAAPAVDAAARARLGPRYYGAVPPAPAMLAEERETESALRAEKARRWEEAGQGRPPPPKWDEGFRRCIGKKPAANADAEIARIALERQKRDALQLLRGGGDGGDT